MTDEATPEAATEIPPEQKAYEHRMADICSIMILHALITDSDPESRDLDLPARVRLANEYAREWSASRGHVSQSETKR